MPFFKENSWEKKTKRNKHIKGVFGEFVFSRPNFKGRSRRLRQNPIFGHNFLDGAPNESSLISRYEGVYSCECLPIGTISASMLKSKQWWWNLFWPGTPMIVALGVVVIALILLCVVFFIQYKKMKAHLQKVPCQIYKPIVWKRQRIFGKDKPPCLHHLNCY